MPSTSARIDTQPIVARAIADASRRTGVGFDYLYNQARVESALDPAARAKTSSASGLFQFTRQTWLATVKASGAAHGLDWAAAAIEPKLGGGYAVRDPQVRQAILDLRFDADASSAMAAEFAAGNREFLESRGHAVENVDLYLAHFLGANGAARFLEAHDAAPDAAAAPRFPEAAAANRAIFYARDGGMRSLAEIRSGFATKMAGEAPPPTVAPTRLASRASAAISANRESTGEAMAMRRFEAMPGKLSLAFASAAYRRLSDLGTGA